MERGKTSNQQVPALHSTHSKFATLSEQPLSCSVRGEGRGAGAAGAAGGRAIRQTRLLGRIVDCGGGGGTEGDRISANQWSSLHWLPSERHSFFARRGRVFRPFAIFGRPHTLGELFLSIF